MHARLYVLVEPAAVLSFSTLSMTLRDFSRRTGLPLR